MSKRLRFAKLRLGKPIEPGEPAPVAVPAEANVCADSTANGKTSKYFAKAGADVCAEEDTFIVIHSEDSGEENEVTLEQSSRRRTQNPPEACPNDGPKLPKLRKKTAEGNALISNFLASQPSQKAEGDDDFEEAKVGSPKLQPKKTKVQRAATKKPVKAPRRPKNQADIRKVFKKYKNDHEVLQELLKEHSAAEQIDPEQLQIALAMSRSLADQECSNHPATTSASFDGEEAQMASSSGTSEERRIVSIRTTLEQFGFRCKNSYTDYDLNVIFGSGSVTKNVKKIKHKRATNLQPRSREELAAFIDGQAKKLFPLEMMQNAAELAAPLDLESCLTSLFWIAQTELPSEQLMEMYYVPELLEVNPAPVGCMLKDWSKIPGRECTPERELDGSAGLAEAVEVERGNEGLTGDTDAVGESSARMSSPDLFDDSEIDNNLSERKENRLALEESTDKAECENEANNEQQEEQSQASLNETGKALDDHEESRAFEEASASDNVEVVEENCIEAPECNSNEQAMENVASTSCVVDGSVTEQEEVIVLDDNSEEEEDKFVTAPEMSECPQPVFHQSSENIFEDTDPNPMVSFEAYSSEEEKISAASRTAVGTVSANGDIGPVDQVPNAVVREDDGKCNTLDREGDCHESEQKREDTSSVSKTVDKNISPFGKEPKFSAEKDLSFTRLAIKARLSEVSSVETVDLLDSAPSNGNPTANLEEIDMESVVGTQCSQQNDTQDHVLYISDDEVNYSIRGEPSRVRETQPEEEEAGASDPEEDPDMTVAYTVPGPTEQCENKESHLSLNSDRPPCLEMEPEVLTISSTENDSEPIVGEVNGAENTFAYLGNLVKEFNLPPLKSQQNGTLEASKSTSSICSISNGKEFDDGSQHLPIEIDDDNDEKERQSGTNRVVQQDVSVIRNNVPEIPDELENYLNNYEEPNFDEHEIEAEMIASQCPRIESVPEVRMPSAKALSRVKSCTQFDSPRVASPLRRTPSEAVLLSSSTPKEKAALEQQQQQPCGGDRFESKFSDLKKAVIDVGPVEYVISTVNVSQQPPEYESMSTPEIERELFKYGLKSLQRHKAVRVLNYLFETMHPYVVIEERKEDANSQLAELESIPTASQGVRKKCKPIAPAGSSTVLKRPRKSAFKLDTTTTDYFLPSKPRKKMAWCAVPLHISFFNLVSESEALQRQILRYEPINLDDIYGILKDGGLRYETNDLIAFLDKYCITFRTAASSGDRTAKVKPNPDSK
ncbi:structure-specific endonuclease subunit SLX4 isoform X1 [Anopheles gambiae]|uniref:structure-specific endonuclease subunit SLX4 isoform X1 n=1 Tax=Anopheles gambiae TaxID=7165 RepID=UPI002AC9DA7F|nr:structure-specific endonuclease subunit SLX4 isoform X1 [Anopheles gambiae]